MQVGIEAIHFYAGQTSLEVRELFRGRGLSLDRFDNLMMKRKSVGLPCEDPVTHAVNAAKPLVDALGEDRSSIEMVVTASESGLDFGKSLSTHVHEHLELAPRCRLFEVKQACYAGTAALQAAVGLVASGLSPGAKALVLATDVAANQEIDDDNYAEPSMGCGAAALLVSDQPHVLALDLGASGMHSYQVADTCRPAVGLEAGDVDLSLMSYLDCIQGAFGDYVDRVEGADYVETFGLLAFHTPFAGLVRSAHRTMMRKFKRSTPEEIQQDFERRLLPSLHYCMEVGNVYSATVFLALCGLLEREDLHEPTRVGLFSYGSGCASEFYSGVLRPGAPGRFRALGFSQAVQGRYPLSFEEYEAIRRLNARWGFGVREQSVDRSPFAHIYERQFAGRGLLTLESVSGYRRSYGWT